MSTAVRVPARATAAIALATVLGLTAFTWPFFAAPGAFADTQTPPLIFGILLLLILAVVFALFTWVFPWVDAIINPIEVTVDQ